MKIFKNIFLMIGVVLTIGFVVFWQPMLNFFGNIGLDDLQIINLFLSIIISWPLAMFVLGVIFLFRFTNEIKKFLEKINIVEAAGVKFSAQQSETLIEKNVIQVEKQTNLVSKEEFEKLLADKDGEIENIKNAFMFAWERAENYEMAYLKRALVPASWLALNWLCHQENKRSSKEWFIQSILVSDSSTDKLVEKEAIFNALLVNELITFENGMMKPTEKAEKFLRYVNIIN